MALAATLSLSKEQLEKQLAARGIARASSEAGKNAAKVAAEQTAEQVERVVTLAKSFGLITANVSGLTETNQWFRDNSYTTAENEATQSLTVWDVHVPYIRDAVTGASRVVEQNVKLEATDLGGVRFGRVEDALRQKFQPVDDCGQRFETTTSTPTSQLFKVGQSADVTWTAHESGGPYPAATTLASNQTFGAGGGVDTTFVQHVSVVDTQAPLLVPPPGFANYASGPVDLTNGSFPLGRPLVVDLADPAPAVTNDAPASLDVGHRYVIDWQATDASGNSTKPMPQVVTIKAPGTNTPPTAQAGSASTTTLAPVEIQLTGADADVLDGRPDPLKFEISEYPAHGQFQAPLYPYFIDDFRLSPVGERENTQTTAKTSPLNDLADGFRLSDPETRGTYLNDNICNAPAGSASETEFNHTIPVDFVYNPTYVYVDDQGYYYVRDYFWVCGETPKDNLQNGGTLDPIPRISKWTDDGKLVAMRPLYPTDSAAYDNTDLSTNLWPADDFSVDHNGRIWVQFNAIVTAGGQSVQVYSYSAALDDPTFHGSFNYDESAYVNGKKLVGIAGDTQLGLLYELQGVPDCTQFPAACFTPHDTDPLLVRRSMPDVSLNGDVQGVLDTSSIDNFGGTDIKVDKEGDVYVLDTTGNRIYKFSPTVRDDAGVWHFGHFIGWLGSCTANKTDSNGVPYHGCDEQSHVSRGYACTDQTCARAADTSGSAPGQFNGPLSIEIDPNDVLYVADTGNSRVQRFGPDGTFAGEADSTGTGVNQGDAPGFILGNFGQPKQLSVNSSSFYVIDTDAQNGDDFVHVFKTMPFYDVTDSSAKVKYVSNFDFQGTDTFSYVTDDGIDRSAPAAVDVSVARAYRPPERLQSQCFADATLASEIPCTFDEDTNIVVRLSAYDPDGFASTGGLDTLTFKIEQAPGHGSLTPLSTTDNAAVYRYTPNANYNGTDSFRFDASDGTDTSAETKAVDLTISPRPDPVTVEMPSSVTGGRGFQTVLTAKYDDIDSDSASDPEAKSLAWGDGATAGTPAWTNSGRRDPNGREITPQVKAAATTGMLIASHVYAETGNYTVTAVMSNAAEGLPDTVATTTVNVIEATSVGAALAAPTAGVKPDTTFPLQIDVTNLQPAGWAGLTAGHVSVKITVPSGLTLATLDGRCTQAAPIVCALGGLAPGQSQALGFTARIALADAKQTSDYPLALEITDDGPHVQDKNLVSLTVSVADSDADGVIDAVDAFPNDARYSKDTDGDGLPDQWEIDHGLDPNVANDTSTDVDGDGFTLAEEFAHGSSPFLAETEAVKPGAVLTPPNTGSDDRFGQALAGGDLNHDGLADTVIGAPLSNGNGAAFIAYGGKQGANPSLQEIDAPSGMSQFGRSVAVGDFDGNGRADVAIASDDAVSIYLDNGEILATPDIVLHGDTAQTNLGVYLAAADLDGDGVADLVATAMPSAGAGQVQVFLSSRGGLAAPPLVYSSGAANLGDTVAVGDIDGDGQADLLVSAASTGNGEVFGFLAADNDWKMVAALQPSFVLQGQSGHGGFGLGLATGGDIGGDGIDDLVVGAYGGAGRVYVYDSTTAYWDVATTGAVSTVAANQTFDGLDDGSAAGDTHAGQYGVRLAMGRLDTDRYADVVVGANREGLADGGAVHVLRGGPGGLASGDAALGTADFGMLGYFVAIPGDIDGDGFTDIVAGAPEIPTAADPSPTGGYVRVLYHSFVPLDSSDDPDQDGVATAFDNCPSVANTNQSDIDGDGIGDVCDDDIDGDGFLNADDNCPYVASSDQTNTDNDSLGDICDSDDDNDGVPDTEDAFPKDARYSKDSDGDGLPDAYETANGLDPNDPADAAADLDGDGRSNLQEFLQGTNIAVDDVPPVLSPPADVSVSSTGAYTAVALGAASASDAKDGMLTPVPDDAGPYRPGRHVVTWSVADAAGNRTTATQQVDVVPQIDFAGAVEYTAAGAHVTVTAELGGDAVAYPVMVPVTISGTAAAGTDYTVDDGTLEIAGPGRKDTLELTIASAAPSIEKTIVLTLGTPVNAVPGIVTQHTIKIEPANLPPVVKLHVEQAGQRRATIVPVDGSVAMQLQIDDPNPSDHASVDWTGTDPALVPAEGYHATTFTFDPSGLAAGVYAVRAAVSDDGSPAQHVAVARLIRVVATAPTLSASVDSDGDGIDDATEGLADANENGIDDYLEPDGAAELLLAKTGGRPVLQTEAGLALALGSTAFASGTDAGVTLADVASFGNGGAAASNAADDGFDYRYGLYDFEIRGLAAPGTAVHVVIPLTGALPAGATYRKYAAGMGWRPFTVDAGDALASAPGALGACPAPGSPDYTQGLHAGDYCVELTLTDGGPDDADGRADGVVRDPGGVATPTAPPKVTVTALDAPAVNVKAGAAGAVALRFRVNVDLPGATLSGITLKASGSGNDAADLSAVKLWVDANGNGRVDAGETQVGGGVFGSDDGTLDLQLDAPYALPAGDTDFIVTYDF